jgi:Icc-related predicted phosphoesterase
MKLCLISDTHSLHDQLVLPDGCDVLVHAGDLCNGDPDNKHRIKELKNATDWLNEQTKRFAHVVAIAGNHDWACQAFMQENCEDILRNDFFKDVHYLRDSGAVIDGVKFYGSPFTPWFGGWAFNAYRGGQIRERWDLIPQNTDVLITHGPPMGVLDRVWNEHVGCADLNLRVMTIRPKVHVFGHVHCGYGHKSVNGTEFFNASVVNEAYEVVNKPWIVEI